MTAFSELELALTSAAVSGDAGALYRIVSGLMDEGVSFESLLFDYLLPLERAVGQRWQQGDYLISEEHAATAAVETVIALLSGMFDRPGEAVSVVVLTAPGDNHSLPARAAAAYLLYLGHDVMFLGASVPAIDLEEFLESDPPDAVLLSCTMSSELVGARAVVEVAHEVGIPVIVGGRGFGSSGAWARAIGADRWCAAVPELKEAIESLDDLTAEGPATEPSPVEWLPLNAAIVAESLNRAVNQETKSANRIQEELENLLGAVAAAMMIDDDQLLVDMLTWQDAALPNYGVDPGVVAASLLETLEVKVPAAASVLARTMGRD